MSIFQCLRFAGIIVQAGAKADRQRKSAAVRAAKARHALVKKELSAASKELRSIGKQLDSLQNDAKIITMIQALENSK